MASQGDTFSIISVSLSYGVHGTIIQLHQIILFLAEGGGLLDFQTLQCFSVDHINVLSYNLQDQCVGISSATLKNRFVSSLSY